MKKRPLVRFALISMLLSLLVFTQSCDSYNKILKSPDLNYKFDMAKKFYYEGTYYKAQPLLEELISAFRGSDRAEEIYYFYAYCDYHMSDFLVASFHFKNYATNFPTSPKVEEMDFMYAYCLYLESPNYSLDQYSTLKALEAFQLYINKYPNSTRVPESNRMMDLLRAKLEQKAYESAMLFYKMEDYRASATMLRSTLMEYPDIRQREELVFLICKSYSLLAENSIQSKQRERYEACINTYEELAEDFPNSKYLKESKKMAENAANALLKLDQEALEKKNQTIANNQ